MAYPEVIPRLWHQTIQAHRREVRDAILETTAALVAQHGLRAVTMSQIAEETGIGRATLYKYFAGVEPILVAWHERHVAEHLAHLIQLRNQPGEPRARLEAVLRAYALISHQRYQHAPDLGALVHQREHVVGPEQQLVSVVRGLLAEAAEAGAIRTDVSSDELATYCLHALASAGSSSSQSAVQRLVGVVMDGLRANSTAHSS
jgi:AcrR family transcriptional regulator